MTAFAHPAVFRAAGLDGSDDDWTADALHLRVRVAGGLGFPLHPFAAWRVGQSEMMTATVAWFGKGGRVVTPPFDPSADGDVIGYVQGIGTAGPDWVWLAVDATPLRSDFRIEVLDKLMGPTGPRVLAARRKMPFEFGGTELAILRATGLGTVRGVRGMRAADLPLAVMRKSPDETFGPPVESSVWFAPGPDPLGSANRRVFDGADKQLGPQDRPDGSVFLLNPADEAARVLDDLAPAAIDPWLNAAFGDPATPPVMAVHSGSEDRTVNIGTPRARTVTQTASLGATDALLTMAIEPAVARYLGLATALPPPRAGLIVGANVWLIAGQWAVSANPRDIPAGGLTAGLAPPWLPPLLDGWFAGVDLVKARYAARPLAEGWQFVTLVAVATAVGFAPPERPAPPRLAADPGYWNPNGTDWAEVLRLADPPPGMVAAARTAPDGLHSLNETRPADGRAAPLLVAPDESGVRRVTDRAVPADASGGAWRVWQADEWGRWSAAAAIAGNEPPRLAPPPPAIEDWYFPAAVADDDLPHSPGEFRLRVAIPDPAGLTPGSRPIAVLRVACPDVTTWFVGGAAVPGPMALITIPSPAMADGGVKLTGTVRTTAVAESAATTITATFADADGRSSDPTNLLRSLRDPRPPRVVPTSPRIIWSGQPDPTGGSELALAWNAGPGQAGFRVYLGDEGRLAESLGLSFTGGTPRAVRAQQIWLRSADLGAKGQFTLLTETPVVPNGATALFRYTLPGTLRGVQFVRVVPVSVGGVEAPFASCGLVPVAVPSPERPPVPVVPRVTPATAGGVTVRIETPGLRADLLAGLAAIEADAVPKYRLRRTRGGTTDPLYVPTVATGELTGAGADWAADVPDGAAPPLPPFVRFTWFAEVRYPPEPDAVPGADIIPDPQAVRPAFGGPGGPAEAAWSDPSLPIGTVLLPPPPAPPSNATFRKIAGTGAATIRLPAAPSPGGYSVVVYKDDGVRWAKFAEVALTSMPSELSDPTAAVGYRAQLVDPIGRVSDSITLAEEM